MKKLIISIVVVILLFIVAVKLIFNKETTNQASTYQVKKGDITITVSAAGSVLPENRLEIKPPVAGRIDEILVKEGSSVKKGEIIAWMSSTERAALLDAAAAKGSQELKRWSSFYKATPVMAPITGTIIQRSVEPGQSFTTSDPILIMSDRLVIKALVDETDIAQIKVGLEASVILDAYSSNPINGVVSQVAYEAKTVSNVTTYQVVIIPESTPPFMKSGMTTSIEFMISKTEDILIIPTSSIITQSNTSKVMLQTEDSFTPKEVTIGTTNGIMAQIVAGLNEDDIILLSPSLEDRNPSSNRPNRRRFPR